MYTINLKQILTGSSVSPGGQTRDHTRIKGIMNVTDPVISSLKGWQRKKSGEWATKTERGRGQAEIDEIPVFLVSLAVVFSLLQILSKHSFLARLLLTAESQSINTSDSL